MDPGDTDKRVGTPSEHPHLHPIQGPWSYPRDRGPALFPPNRRGREGLGSPHSPGPMGPYKTPHDILWTSAIALCRLTAIRYPLLTETNGWKALEIRKDVRLVLGGGRSVRDEEARGQGRQMGESQLVELRNIRVLLEESRGLSRNLAYHRRAKLEAVLGQALEEVERQIEELRGEGRGRT